MSAQPLTPAQTRRLAVEERLIPSVILSFLLLTGSLVYTWRIGLESNQIYHKLWHTQMGLEDLKHFLRQAGVKP